MKNYREILLSASNASSVCTVINKNNPEWGSFDFIFESSNPGIAILKRGHRSAEISADDFSNWLVSTFKTETEDFSGLDNRAHKMVIQAFNNIFIKQ